RHGGRLKRPCAIDHRATALQEGAQIVTTRDISSANLRAVQLLCCSLQLGTIAPAQNRHKAAIAQLGRHHFRGMPCSAINSNLFRHRGSPSLASSREKSCDIAIFREIADGLRQSLANKLERPGSEADPRHAQLR